MHNRHLEEKNLKLKRYGFVGMLAVVLLLASLRPGVIFAERQHPEEEAGGNEYEVCTLNHLREECWERDGNFLTYTEDGYTTQIGVDVSKWNGDIDWDSLWEQGVEFAIIRIGFRGYENGELVLDDRFYEYLEGAINAGMEVGVYFFSQAIDEEEAVEEAQFVVDNLYGFQLDLPIYFDTEEVAGSEARTDYLLTANYTLNAEAFCQAIEEAGYQAGVYASQGWIRRNLDLSLLSDYEIWYAMYGSTPGREYGFDMWQYTEEGDFYGCDTYLDLNVRVERE